jgi:integrase
MYVLYENTMDEWMRSDQRFEARCVGNGLYVRYRKSDRSPRWFLRYQRGGRARTIQIGSYSRVSVRKAHAQAEEMQSRIEQGIDLALKMKAPTLEKDTSVVGKESPMTVADLTEEYLERRIVGRLKNARVIGQRIDRNIKQSIGHMPLTEVRPRDIDAMLVVIIARGAPAVAADTLRWAKKLFAYGIKRDYLSANPAALFDQSDAGGKRKSRDRWLARDELALLFAVMASTPHWRREHTLIVTLLLMTGCRKSELMCASKSEFDLANGRWHLAGERTKTGDALSIALPYQAVALLREAFARSTASPWLFPTQRGVRHDETHMNPSTLNAALTRTLRPSMLATAPFTLHDLRRTVRTHLEVLGTAPEVAERCLNHRLKGVVGVYNRHDYFEERKVALQKWANVLAALGAGAGPLMDDGPT